MTAASSIEQLLQRGFSEAAATALIKESAVSLSVLERMGVYSESDAKAASKLLGRAPKFWEGHLPVVMYPYTLPFHRDPVRYRGKPSAPFESRKEDGSISTAKYVEAKGSAVHLYFGPSLLDGRALKDTSIPLWLTEGEKKCLSAESHGLSCVAVSGVNQWHEKGVKSLHPDFAHIGLEGRDVLLAFDRDALSNKLVRDQEVALGRALVGAGASVYIVRFPEDASKLDDFLARHELSELGALIEDAKKHGRIAAEARGAGVPAPATETTDLANAERFERMHGGNLRFCRQTSTWLAWRDKRWEADDDDLVVRRAYRTVRKIYEEADALPDEDARSAMRQHARKSEGQARVAAMVKMAGALKRFAVRLEQFDADPWSLNCLNGTVDLRTGELREHRPDDFITKLAPVHFDPDARHERWEAFLDHVTDGQVEVRDFLARAVGYSLTGDTREDKLFFIYGPPGRGKSTFVGAIEATLGDYARTADVATFLASPYGSSSGDKPRPDLVRLAGSRICVCKEIDAGAKLAEGLVKTITGGDVITVRDLHSRPLELRPTFKLWLVANDPPTVRGDDAGMWRRIVRVPFLRALDKLETGFREALHGEPELRAAVLAWAVQGVQRWLEGGLQIPDVVAASTAEYRAEMDPVGEFFERRCVIEWDARVVRKTLRKAYEEWCAETGHAALGPRRFAAALRERVRAAGLEADKLEVNVRSEGRFVDGWKCIRLLSDLEMSVDRAWGHAPKVHRHDVRGDVGSVGNEKVSFSYTRPTDNQVPPSQKKCDPHSPQSPHKIEKEEEKQPDSCGDECGECGEEEKTGSNGRSNRPGEGPSWRVL